MDQEFSSAAQAQAKLFGLLQNFVSTPSRDDDPYTIAPTFPSTPRLGFK
jgi:hypothetical protein